MPNTELFYDPLSADFITEVQQPIRDESIEERLSLVTEHVPRRRRANRVKFYLSLDLRKRLQILVNKSEEGTPIIAIAKELLSTKYVDVNSINYLDLSNDDYTKISFLNKDRYEKIKDDVFSTYYITPQTKILAKYSASRTGTYKDAYGSLSFGQHNAEVLTFFNLTKRMVPTDVRMKSKKFVKAVETREDGSTEYIYDYTYEAPDNFNIDRLYVTDGDYNNRYFCFKDGKLENLHASFPDLSWKFEKLKQVIRPSVWNPEQRFHSSIHKVLNKLYPTQFTEREKNIFAEAYYKLIIIADKDYDFSIVKGEAIREAYLDKNYLHPINNGTLWNSCMRYSHCQSYLDLYVNNPDIVSLAVLRKHNMVAARAIIWTDPSGNKHIDRIYIYDAKCEALISASLDTLGYKYVRGIHGDQKYDLTIPLEYAELMNCTKFPYVDSLKYYNIDTEELQNHPAGYVEYLEFNQTDGTYYSSEGEDHECEFCQSTSTDRDFLTEVTYGRHRGSYGCDDCTAYSDVLDVTLNSDYASYCDFCESWVPEGDMIELANGSLCYNGFVDLREYQNDYGFFVINDENFAYLEFDGDYYHPEDTSYLELISEQQIEENETNNDNQENHDNQESINTESVNDVVL